MDIPQWHETTYDAREVVNLRAVADMPGAPSYSALRSYATGRREHAVLGPMPAPVARIANRRLWLMREIDQWLTIPFPVWQRSRQAIEGWINAGRPRSGESGNGAPTHRATLASDDGPGTPAP